jgi:hypothetical protein
MKNQQTIKQCFARATLFLAIFTLMTVISGTLQASSPGSPETKIAAPTANAATSITATSFNASWTSVPGTFAYKLYVSRYAGTLHGGIPLWIILENYNGKNIIGLGATVTDLSGGTLYRYCVQAASLDQISVNSNYVEVTTTLDPPVANNATNITPITFNANWSAVTGATSYLLRVVDQVTQQWIELNREVSTTTYTVSNLVPDREYSFSVKAKKGDVISELSNWKYVTTTSASAPVATAASNIACTSFQANWTAKAGATSYLLRVVDQATQDWIELDREVSGTSFTVSNLTPEREYSYSLKAKYGDVISGIGNWIYATTTVASPTTATAASSITTSTFTANWTAMPGATSYLLRVSDDLTQQFVILDQVIESTSYIVTGLNPNRGYRYAIKVKYGEVVSAISNWISLNTKPIPPVATEASNITTSSFNANWNAAAGATSYKLWIISNVNTGYNPAGYFPKSIGNVTTYNVTGLTPGHSYSYYVQVVTSSGESTASNAIDVTTKPTTPAAMNASNITSSSFVANWQTVISATGYKLSVWRTSDYQWVSGYNGKIVSGTSEVVSGLSPSTEYQYSLKSLAGETESDNSNYITLTTLAAQPSTYTLSLSSSPAGAGTLSGGGTFNEGTTVTAHAAPNAGYSFVNWTEGGVQVSASASYTFNITSNRNLVANFTQQVINYTLTSTVAPAGGGTTSIPSQTFSAGTSVTITATPNAGYSFVNWTEGSTQVSTSASYTFNITSNRNLVANFTQQVQNYTLTTLAAPTEGGTTNISSETYASGTSVTVTATPTAGYSFVNWTEGSTQVSTSASYTFNITSNRNLVANFELKTVTITLSANPSSGGTTNFATNNYIYGQNATINANANANNTFISWTENGEVVSTENTYTFVATEDRTLVANFEFLNSIYNQGLVELKIFPNPTTCQINIKGLPHASTVKLVTLTGSIVRTIKAEKSELSISANDLRKGLYLVVIESESFNAIRKVIVE